MESTEHPERSLVLGMLADGVPLALLPDLAWLADLAWPVDDVA